MSDVPTEGLRDDPDEPVHQRLDREPGDEAGPLEDTVPAPPGEGPGSGELAPEFQEPGEQR